jgi:hypothetical protein
MNASGQLCPPASLPPGKVPQISIGRRQAGPQNPSGRGCEEKLALHTLRGNADHHVLPADKGNAMVVRNTSDYK